MLLKLTQFSILLLTLSIPLENVIGKYPMFGSLSRMVGVLLFFVAVFAILVRNWVYRTPQVIIPLVIFVLWAGFSFTWSMDPTTTKSQFFTYLQLVTMVWIFWQFVDTQEMINKLFHSYLLGSYILCFLALSNFMNQVAFKGQRFAASGYDPNFFGVTLALAIPIAWHLYVNSRNLATSVYSGLYIPLCLATVILTGSRGALISTLVSSLYILFALPKMDTRKKLVFAFLGIAGIVFFSYFLPTEQWERFSGMGEEILHGEASGRKSIWSAGLKVFVTHPWIGIGDGAYPYAIQPIVRDFKVAHQTFIGILVETGVIGFGAFFTFLFFAFKQILAMHKSTDRTVCMAILVTWLVSGLSLSVLLNKFSWIVFTFVLLLPRMYFLEKTTSQADNDSEISTNEVLQPQSVKANQRSLTPIITSIRKQQNENT